MAKLEQGLGHRRVKAARLREADADLARQAAPNPLRYHHGLADAGQDRADPFREDGTRFRQRHSAWCSVHEADADLLFQRLDLLRERWLCDADPFGRAGKAELIGDREEVS